jgi:hypothetical protein
VLVLHPSPVTQTVVLLVSGATVPSKKLPTRLRAVPVPSDGDVVVGDGLDVTVGEDGGVVAAAVLCAAGCFCISAIISGHRTIFHTPASSTTSLLAVCGLSLAKSLYR